MSGMFVEVSARTFAVPFECPCCGAAPDAELTIPVTRAGGRTVARDTARALEFPYCARCIAHAGLWDSAGQLSTGVFVAGIVTGVAVALATQLVIGAIAFVAALLLAWSLGSARRVAARAGCAPSCASPDRAVEYLGWSGATSAFAFESPTYGARFAEQNAALVVNESAQLRKLLEGHRIARLLVPTPAAAVVAVPPPATTAEWIARLEAPSGVVARRDLLRRALDAVSDPAERAQLVEAAARVELAPVYERLDGIGGEAARRQQLQRALDEVRADNLPEALRAAEVRALEQLLRELR